MFKVNRRTMVLMALLPLVAASCTSTGGRSGAKKIPPALDLMVRKEMNVLTDRLELTGEQLAGVRLVIEGHYRDLYAQAKRYRDSGQTSLEAIRTDVSATSARTVEKLKLGTLTDKQVVAYKAYLAENEEKGLEDFLNVALIKETPARSTDASGEDMDGGRGGGRGGGGRGGMSW